MIPFSKINKSGGADYNAKYQRHHLIPLQAYSEPRFGALFSELREVGFSIDDFSTNGVLLPCEEGEAYHSGMPLHRGPHPQYNELVMDRLDAIERTARSASAAARPHSMLRDRVWLFQKALARGLKRSENQAYVLNNRDPVRAEGNFEELDACVDILWASTGDE